MADKKSTFTIGIKAVDETKKAFDSVKQNAKKAGVSPMGAGSAGGPAVPAALPAGKQMAKSIDKMVKYLRNIDKEITNLGQTGSGGGGKGKGGATLPGMPGGKGGGGMMGGMGGMMKFLGPIAAVAGIAAAGYGMLKRAGGAYSSTAGQQLGAIQSIGTTPGAMGGMFGGNYKYGISPSQQAEFVKNFSTQKDYFETTRLREHRRIKGEKDQMKSKSAKKGLDYNPLVDDEYEKKFGWKSGLSVGQQEIAIKRHEMEASGRGVGGTADKVWKTYDSVDKKFQYASKLSAAYGMDVGQVGDLMGKMERYGGSQDGGAVNQSKRLMAMAYRGGMGGARSQEFFNMFEGVMTSAVASGMTTSNKDMMGGLGMLMQGNNERWKTLAPDVIKQGNQVLGQGSMLRGGGGSSLALAALSQKHGGDMMKAQDALAKGMTPENMKAIYGFVRDQFGSRMGAMILQREGLMGNVKGATEGMKYMDMVADSNTNKQGSFSGIKQEDLNQIMKERLEATGDMTEKLRSEDVLDEITNLGLINQFALDTLEKIDKTLADILSGQEISRQEEAAKTDADITR